MKTGVLVHGCNLNIENWRHVAWGDPPHALGRIPQGILVALEAEADVIVFGTGASSKAFRWGNSKAEAPVLAEAEYSLAYLRENFESLKQFEVLSNLEEFSSPASITRIRDRVLGKIILDLESQNTIEEITNAGVVFSSNDVDRAILVSSPSHIVRCLRDATKVYHSDETCKGFRDRISAVPSRTCYEGTSAADVVVVEPPHRPDRHVVPTHRRIQRMLTLQKLEPEDLMEFIVKFDDLLQEYEHQYFNS